MSNNYVKKFECGNLFIDLPYFNWIYELPLFHFNDLRNSIGLSLIFNRKMFTSSDNSYNISNGFKFNIQKRIIFGSINYYQEANGNKTKLTNENGVFGFDDDSKRIISPEGSNYILEYFDYSKEIYNSDGYIIEAYDKYGDKILSYSYINNLLDTVVFKNSQIKQIKFNYQNNKLDNIVFMANSSLTISFSSNSNVLSVNHYNGVDYTLNCANNSFLSTIFEIDNQTSYTYHKECIVNSDNQSITLNDKIGEEVIDSRIYNLFIDSDSEIYNKYIEITDFYGKKIRQQYFRRRLLCDYEVNGDDVCFTNNHYYGVVNVYETQSKKNNIFLKQYLNNINGVEMTPEGECLKYVTNLTNSYDGYYVISGWFKQSGETFNPNYNEVRVSDSIILDSEEEGGLKFEISGGNEKKWTFFSICFYMSSTMIFFKPSSYSSVLLKEVKITPYLFEKNNENDCFTKFEENILIKKNENNFILMDDLCFSFVNSSEMFNDVYFDDILKYKLNKYKNVHLNQFYRNNLNEIYVGSQCANVEFSTENDFYNWHLLDDYNLGKRIFTHSGIMIYEYEIDSNGISVKVTSNSSSRMELSKQIYNNYLDLIESNKDNITISYDRNKGLVEKEKIDNIEINYTFDEIENVITKIDEFNNETQYTYDNIFGSLIKIDLPNDTTIEYEYDDDKQTVLNTTFTKNNLSRTYSYSYEGGYLKSVENSSLNYVFDYDLGKLNKASQNNSLIEEHNHTKYNTTSYYPSQANDIYSFSKNYDGYRRLGSVNNFVNNVYDVKPDFDAEDGSLIGVEDNGSSLLAMSTDNYWGTVSRYKYIYYNHLKSKTMTEIDYSKKISTEEFEYNDYRQLIESTYLSHPLNKLYTSKIEYDNLYYDENNILEINNRPKKYEYKIDSGNSIETTIQYDKFQRINFLNINFSKTEDNNNYFKKTFVYDKTRIENIIHSRNNSEISRNSYQYDLLGRIQSDTYLRGSSQKQKNYLYDGFGQLIRENNEELNKTFVYDYDEYGNLISRKQYNYTLNDLENNSYTEKNFSYTNSNKNQLSTYNNKALLYDSEGKLTDYNGFVYSWDKKFLTQISSKPNIIKAISFSPIKTYTFTYNSNGQRTRMFYSKSIPSSEIVPINPNEMISLSKAFHYDNFGRLVSEGRTETYVDSSFISSQIDYLYCEKDIIGFDHTRDGNTSRYYFEKNLQNDVIAIYDLNGNLKVKYNYDAWGNCSLGSETTDSTLANINPIRYRSYYYDVETQLYWVSSRYYSPELCRWISPDSIEYLDPESINGLNLYCYCHNNPIMYYDPDGHKPKLWQWLISGLEVAAGIALCFVPGVQGWGVTLIGTGVGSMVNGYINESNGGSFVAGWWGGQVSGFISAIPGIGVPLGAFVGSVTTDWIDYGWKGIDWNKALLTGAIAWGASLFPTLIGEVASKFHIYDKALYFVNVYNTILTSTANSIINVYWRGKNIEK